MQGASRPTPPPRTHLGRERDLGGLEWVVGGEVDVDEEDPSRVGAIRGAHDGRLPAEEVVTCRPGAAGRGGVLLEVLKGGRSRAVAWEEQSSRHVFYVYVIRFEEVERTLYFEQDLRASLRENRPPSHLKLLWVSSKFVDAGRGNKKGD